LGKLSVEITPVALGNTAAGEYFHFSSAFVMDLLLETINKKSRSTGIIPGSAAFVIV
jgi:hypothetical protein